jgi:tetratricopeptide (TPR) repeat protein
MKVLAYEEAAGHYQRALRAQGLQARPVEAERCELLLELAAARMAAGEPEEARAHYRRAAEGARRMGDGPRLARAAFGLGREFTAGSVDEDYDRAAQALGQLHFAWHVPLFRAGQELLAGRLDEAERLAAEALALGRRTHDPLVVIYHTIVPVGLRWQQGRLPELEATSAGSSTGSRPTSAGGRAPCRPERHRGQAAPRHPRVGIPAPGPAGRDPVPLGRGGGPLHGGHAGPRAHGRRPVPGRRPCRARPSPPGREGAGTG